MSSVTSNAGTPQSRVASGRIVTTNRWLKIARIHDELWLEGEPEDPRQLINQLQARSISADILTFAQKLPSTEPRHKYPMDWDNWAVASTTDFSAWWEWLPQETRKNVRRAERRGLVVREVVFDRKLAEGLKGIYDETPIRQGRRFIHYRKGIEAVERENSSYLDRSMLLGAFYKEELVGFLKMVVVGQTARIMQIISQNAHFDKRPTNALLAKGMEACNKRGLSTMIYGQYIYDGKTDSPVTEFKRRNGFKELLLPRYFIPLTAKGKAAMRFGLHRGVKSLLPQAALKRLLAIRAAWYERMSSHAVPGGSQAATD